MGLGHHLSVCLSSTSRIRSQRKTRWSSPAVYRPISVSIPFMSNGGRAIPAHRAAKSECRGWARFRGGALQGGRASGARNGSRNFHLEKVGGRSFSLLEKFQRGRLPEQIRLPMSGYVKFSLCITWLVRALGTISPHAPLGVNGHGGIREGNEIAICFSGRPIQVIASFIARNYRA